MLVPFFLIRFGLLALLDKTAIGRAAHFAPMANGEKAAYWVYQLANLGILLYMFFLPVCFAPAALFYPGAAVYLAGTTLLVFAVAGFANPAKSGINQKGIYRFSRNPMYVAYFVFFMGCVLLTQSLVLLGLVLLFQTSAHWVILAEERWCTQHFGDEYLAYKKRVRRYL